jgi:hypothetical protein
MSIKGSLKKYWSKPSSAATSGQMQASVSSVSTVAAKMASANAKGAWHGIAPQLSAQTAPAREPPKVEIGDFVLTLSSPAFVQRGVVPQGKDTLSMDGAQTKAVHRSRWYISRVSGFNDDFGPPRIGPLLRNRLEIDRYFSSESLAWKTVPDDFTAEIYHRAVTSVFTETQANMATMLLTSIIRQTPIIESLSDTLSAVMGALTNGDMLTASNIVNEHDKLMDIIEESAKEYGVKLKLFSPID